MNVVGEESGGLHSTWVIESATMSTVLIPKGIKPVAMEN